MVNEQFEDQPVIDMLIPVHQEAIDKRKEKLIVEENYLKVLHTRA